MYTSAMHSTWHVLQVKHAYAGSSENCTLMPLESRELSRLRVKASNEIEMLCAPIAVLLAMWTNAA